jgi:predicted acylesterase/phospholipase RssA
VASDLVTGELVELSDTPLFLAMRASLAVPGVFAPVRVNQRLLVDGGLVRNLPVDVAREMGADIIIAVNVGTPLAQEKELISAVSVAQQMLQILTEQNVQRSLKELRPGDVLLQPDLGGIGFLDFARHDRAMKRRGGGARHERTLVRWRCRKRSMRRMKSSACRRRWDRPAGHADQGGSGAQWPHQSAGTAGAVRPESGQPGHQRTGAAGWQPLVRTRRSGARGNRSARRRDGRTC